MKSTWENKKEKMSLNYWQRSIWDAKGEPRKHLWTVDDRREGRRSLKTYENTLNVNLPVKIINVLNSINSINNVCVVNVTRHTNKKHL